MRRGGVLLKARGSSCSMTAASSPRWHASATRSVKALPGLRPSGGASFRQTARTPTRRRRNAKRTWVVGPCSTTTSWRSRWPTDGYLARTRSIRANDSQQRAPEYSVALLSLDSRRPQALTVRCSRVAAAIRQGRASYESPRPHLRGRTVVRRCPRIRGHGHAADRERRALEAQLHPPRAPRAGEEQYPALAHYAARRRHSDRRRQRGERQPIRPGIEVCASVIERSRRRHSDR